MWPACMARPQVHEPEPEVVVEELWAACLTCEQWRIVPRQYREDEHFYCHMVGKTCDMPGDDVA